MSVKSFPILKFSQYNKREIAGVETHVESLREVGSDLLGFMCSWVKWAERTVWKKQQSRTRKRVVLVVLNERWDEPCKRVKALRDWESQLKMGVFKERDFKTLLKAEKYKPKNWLTVKEGKYNGRNREGHREKRNWCKQGYGSGDKFVQVLLTFV